MVKQNISLDENPDGSLQRAAMHIWGKQTFAEILNVDKSREMNHLSQLMLQGGHANKPPLIPSVIYRQFMPHGREVRRYDLKAKSV